MEKEDYIKMLDYYAKENMKGSKMYKMLYYQLLEKFDYDYEKERV